MNGHDLIQESVWVPPSSQKCGCKWKESNREGHVVLACVVDAIRLVISSEVSQIAPMLPEDACTCLVAGLSEMTPDGVK